MTDARGIGPNTLRAILDGLGLKLVKMQNLPANVGRSPELALVERVSIKPRDYIARWSPDIHQDDQHDETPHYDEKRIEASFLAISALDVPQCRRCRGTGYLIVGTMQDRHTCLKCDGSGRKNR